MSDRQLNLAVDLALPVQIATEAIGIFGRRGSGKTSTAVVLVEELLDHGLPVVVLDPLGVWWGLRSSVDGTSRGYPVLIVGGDHADIPLDENAGTRLAEIVVEQRLPMVIDLSDLSHAGLRRFATAFLRTLFRGNKGRPPLHLVVDEADMFAPQRLQADMTSLFGAVDAIARRGRQRGIGCTLITQRPAVLNLDVRSQVELLVALQLTVERDRKAVDEWVVSHAETVADASLITGSLPSLPVGGAWIWSPRWVPVRRVQIRPRRTFDSSATPEVGADLVVPTSFAEVDPVRVLALLNIEPAAAGADPAVVAQLRDDLRAARAELEELRARPPQVVKVPAVSPVDQEILTALIGDLDKVAASIRAGLDLAGGAHAAMNAAGPVPGGAAELARAAGRSARARVTREPEPASDGVGLRLGARRLVEVAARHHPMRLTVAQLATLAKLKRTGGTFSTYYSEIRRRGLIEETDGSIVATAAGLEFAGVAGRQGPMSTRELREMWDAVLRAGARRMLAHLLNKHPGAVTRAQLAAHVALTATAGTFGTYLGDLRRNGLIYEEGDKVWAAEVFFLAEDRP